MSKNSVELEKAFKTPISCIISARCLSGKSYLIKEFLNSKHFRKNFNEICIFSSTAYLDDAWEEIKNMHYINNELDDTILQNMLNSIEEEVTQTEEKPRISIIVDDFLDKFTTKKSNLLDALSFKGHHYNISYIFSTQKYKALSHLICANLLTKIFFKIVNANEFKSICDELSTIDYNSKDISKFIFENTKNKYNYVVIKDCKNSTKFIKGNGFDLVEKKPNKSVLKLDF